MTRYRIGMCGLALLAVAGMVYVVGHGSAGETKALQGDVRKIAMALKKGDKEGAEKLAKTTAKKLEEVGDAMHLFKPRNKGGLGYGEKAAGKSDGIEVKLREVGRDVPAGIAKESPNLEQLGYDTAALALITEAMAPKDQGKKTRKEWLTWSQEMRDHGVALASAAKSQGAQDVKAAAVKINNTCNSCHSMWR